MRNSKQILHRTNKGNHARYILKAVMAVLLFSLIFSSVILSINNFKFASADSRSATSTTISRITNGLNVADEFNNLSDSSLLSRFGISSSRNDAVSGFRINPDGRGWGYDDWARNNGGTGVVYWLEYTFTRDALQAVKDGRVSFRAVATGCFGSGSWTTERNDAFSMAIAFIGDGTNGTQVASSDSDMINAISGESWSNSNYTSSNYRGVWGDPESRTFTFGSSGTFDDNHVIPTNATALRLVFAAVVDYDLCGGFKDINLSFAEKVDGTIESTTSTYDLSKTLYGEDYTLQNGSTSSMAYLGRDMTNSGKNGSGAWGTKHMFVYSNAGRGNFDEANTATETQYDSDNGNASKFDSWQYQHNWSDSFIPHTNGSGILSVYGCTTSEFTYYLATYITVPGDVTSFTISADLFTALCFIGYGTYGNSNSVNDMHVSVKAKFDVYAGVITSIPNASNALKSSGENLISRDETTKVSDPGESGVEFAKKETNESVTITRSRTDSAQTYSIVLSAEMKKNDYWWSKSWGITTNGDDFGQMYAVLGNLHVTHKGYYGAEYNANGGSGSMGNSTFHYGLTDSTETLTPNGFVNGDSTFVGWATTPNGSVEYQNVHNTSVRELTNVPGEIVKLYAVWRDSDFSRLPSGTSGLWGSANNPFVISDRDEWINLIDIVNKNRDPVNSVSGTYYDKTISTNATEVSFANCYFVITSNIEIGGVAPVGNKTENAFRGTVYGGTGVYSATRTLRELSNLSVDVSTGQAGLFGSVNGASIEYIDVSGTVVNRSADNGTYAGGIVGYARGTSSFINCVSRVNVVNATFDVNSLQPTGKQGAGGIVGFIAGGANTTIENCTYEGGSPYVASSIGGDKYFEANIYGLKSLGGIVGHTESVGSAGQLLISGCASISGSIQGEESAGGIAGIIIGPPSSNRVVLSHVYNATNIYTTGNSGGQSATGGIAGYIEGQNRYNNSVVIKYAYNRGTITGEKASVGGILGNTWSNNVANLQIEYCYNMGTISGNSSVDGIKGSGSATVSSCWSFYAQSGTSADFSGLTDGTKAVIALGDATKTAFDYFRPSDASNTTTYNWTDITNTNIEFNKFLVIPTATLVPTDKYLSIYAKNNGSTVTPDFSNNNIPDSSNYNPSVTVQNIVFDASMTDVTQLAIEFRDISAISQAKEITYGENNPSVNDWVASNNNPYVTEFEIQYRTNGSWMSDAVNVYYDGGVKAYSVKVMLYNGDSIVGVKIFNSYFTVKQRELKVAASWYYDRYPDLDSKYKYNGLAQGVKKVVFSGVTGVEQSGFASGESITSEFDTVFIGVTPSVTVNEIALETVNAGKYGIELTLKTQNYKLNTVGGNNIGWKWEIEAILISNPDVFDENAYDIFFGYGVNGIASGSYTFLLNENTNLVYSLDMRAFGVFYGTYDSPYALVYKDSSVHNKITSYNLYIKADGGYDTAVRGQDYDIAFAKGARLDGENIIFDGGSVVSVEMTFTGKNNFNGSRTVRFTLMDGDFGGRANESNYGSESNPYLIENDAHLVRLGQIVSGAPAWNSINNSANDPSISVASNINAVAVSRTYFAGYFLMTEDVSAKTASGFVPIGRDGVNYFSGTFNGNNHIINLDINIPDSGENEYGWSVADCVGLFGYVDNSAILIGITTDGSVLGRDRVGGIAGYANINTVFKGTNKNNAKVTGRSFVGGIVGELFGEFSGVLGNAQNGEDAVISGVRAVGGIVGGISSANSLSIENCDNFGKVAFKAYENDSLNATLSALFTVNDRGRALAVNGIGGIVGFICTNNIRIIDCKNHENASDFRVDGAGANGVGGIVGFASIADGGISIEATVSAGTVNSGYVRGLNFVGGIVGYACNVTIEANCRVNSYVTGTGEYAGGIAGKWIVNDVAQMPGQRSVQSNVYITGETYVGGLVGWLDAKNAKGLKLNPFITNGKDNPIRVIGTSYVGALYGGIEGYGYKRNSANVSSDDSVVYITPSSAGESIYVSVIINGGGHVAGGLIGYASGMGILFLGDWVGLEHTPVTFNGSTSFFGGIIGVLGENANIESATNNDGNVSVGGVTHSVKFRASESANDINVGGDFIGSIVGYIASSAGAYFSSDTTFMGNNIKLFNNSSIRANSFVGGIFGALGKVAQDHYTVTNGINENIFNDIYLMNLIRYGSYGSQATGVATTLRYAPSDDGGLGKMMNYRPIIGSGDFIGGLVGYAGANSLLALYNPVISGSEQGFTLNNVETYLNIYNGYGSNPTVGDTTTIIGANYVGGIAGYISDSAHEMTRLVSVMLIKANAHGNEDSFAYDGNYAGGLFGYMGGGSVLNSIATSGYSNPSAQVNAFMGNEYVGGIVGMLAGGSIGASVSRGFRFASVNMTRGGIAGSVNAGTTINASWTFYLANNPTYATVSQNKNGNYIIVNSDVVSGLSPSFSEYGRMVGLFAESVSIVNRASNNTYNPTKSGYLSISTKLPQPNNQLVFYDASGSDRASANNFETLSGANEMVYYRFDMATTESFSICVLPISFKNINSNPQDEGQKKQFVKNAYVRPSASEFYDVDVQSATYAGGYIETASGSAICKGNNNPNDTNNIVVLGTFNRNFEIGDASTPYVISNQTEWNRFAENIRTNATVNGSPINGYQGKYIKLATDDVIISVDLLAGDRNSNDNVFRGTFDGDGHKLTIQVESSTPSVLSGVSVFPNASGATFKNLTVEGWIKATGNALNYQSDDDSANAANIAGFVGKPLGDLRFENCTNLVNINAQRTAGGIVGFTNGNAITLISCVNKGNIECSDVKVSGYQNYNYGTGGIIGYATNTITIESCKNEGNIIGAYNVGGIIGQNDAETNIYNCANTGNILGDGFWASEAEYAGTLPPSAGTGYTDTYRLIYAGGILGQVGPNGYLNMLACYNSGEVTGYGIIEGGLVGSVGRLMMESSFANDYGQAGGKSVIAYCYNTGSIYSGGRNRNTSVREHVTDYNNVGREELNGTLCGGIVGFIAWGDIKYCYNAGKITALRMVAKNITSGLDRSNQWQVRAGGIAGQAQPSGTNHTVRFENCYNVGKIYVDTYVNLVGRVYYLPCYGGGILGYVDNGESSNPGRVSSSECYTIANYLHYIERSRDIGGEKWASISVYYEHYSSTDNWNRYDCHIPGTSMLPDGTPLTVEHFTTYVSSNGKLTVDRPIGGSSTVEDNNSASSLIDENGTSLAQFDGTKMNYDDAFLNGNAYGYIYIYGCLPQLAVFALDTKEGLSMMSVSYGRNDYGEFIGNQAGSKESPYVIKDGVGLLAMSALNGAKSNTGGAGRAYYNFKDKYIEFADGTNNIESATSRYINMDMSYDSGATADSIISLKSASEVGNGAPIYRQFGKNYFLWRDGAVSGVTSFVYGSNPTSASAMRNSWVNKNHYFNGLEMTAGSGFVNFANFYPIGNESIAFEGSISGQQGEFNTEIKNLRISQRSAGSLNSVAGLFGVVYDASVSYITVDGEIRAYASQQGTSYRSFAGGIAGYAGGDTVILNCQAGSAKTMLTVEAHSITNNVSLPNNIGYAGGIAGAVGPSGAGATSQSLKTLEIRNSRASNATVNSLKANSGGIVGYVGNPWNANGATAGSGNYVNIYDVYVYNSNISTLKNVITSNTNASSVSTDIAGIDVGGVVGTNDGNTLFTINGAYIGTAYPTESATELTVNIKGENSIGGVIGTARGNTAISNADIADSVYITREAHGMAENVPDGLYRTAIGGVIGRTLSNTVNTLRDIIVYNGNINIGVANTNASDNNPTGNIGGVIGAMGEGTRFLSGSIVTVTGSISVSDSLKEYVRNFGGVVGATIEGAFDGTFNVSPRISADNATNVGGFIGRNFGTANILSSESGTVIKIEADITGKSQVGGLVGLNGYTYSDGTVAGTLLIGADTYLGGRYEGTVNIEISKDAHIRAIENDAGGLIGNNIANGNGLGLIITKGTIYNKGTVAGLNNVGGIVGNNEGDITMGGSNLQNAIPILVNEGNVSGGTFGGSGEYVGDGNNVGGVIGYLQKGSIAGTFANTGSVSGGYFVGGSVGRLDSDALITVSGSNNTYFYNGTDGSHTGDVFAGSAVGNVSGKMYVGGSIGGMFGSVRGASSSVYVSFVNDGIVEGETFTGGNIGLLAGGVDYAQFSNAGRVVASGAVAIGGSVGFIGISKQYDAQAEDYEHQAISIRNAHFEFVADLDDGGDANGIKVSGSAPSGKGEFEWGGVGGAIGVIGDSNDGFDNINGLLWQNVTLYAEGSISAPDINNVGGAIGLIKANNIVISNMLAFYTSVSGRKNVGGIVGAVIGLNIEINNSFNIEGTVSGDTAGGIVGWVVKDGDGATVADTSYWVKGYANAELMALDLEKVVENLGKYVAVADGTNVFTKELTDAFGTPAHYTGNDADGTDWAVYLKNLCGRDVQIVNGVWAYEQNADGYTTGEASTGWYYVYANDRRGLDATHVSAKDNSKPSVLQENERAGELVYWKRIASAYTAEELRPDENGVIEATRPLNSAIVGQVSGNTVSGNGEVAEGYIYAAALESKVNGYYLYMDASGVKPSIYYSSNSIDWNDTGESERPFYLTAKTSLVNENDKNAQNVVVYYRSVGVGGTLTYNGYKRYVPITAEIGKSDSESETQVIKYLSSDDMLKDGKSGDYVYTMTNVKRDGTAVGQDEVCTAGNYTIDVSIYFYDTLGNYGKIGGINEGTLRIEKMLLESSLTASSDASNGVYNGDNTNGVITLTLNGIVPLDNGRNTLSGDTRSVRFNISGKTSEQISGVLDLGALMNDVGGTGSRTFTASAEDRALSKALVDLKTNKMYMSSFTVEKSRNMDNLIWDTECIADDLYDSTAKTYQITVQFRFVETISDTFVVELDTKGVSASYITNPTPLEVKFNIKPALLEFKLSDGAKDVCEYDGATHFTQYEFTGWVANASEDKTKLINSLKPYLQYTSLAEENKNQVFGSADSLWNITSSNSYVLTDSGKVYVTASWNSVATVIRLEAMKEKGNYFVRFAQEATYELDGVKYMLTEGGNYYVKVPTDTSQSPAEQKPLYKITPNAFTLSWSKDNTSTYDATYHYLEATFEARFAFASAELIIDEIKTLFPTDYDEDSYTVVRVNEQSVKVRFRVGPNAGVHKVELPSDSTDNCIIKDISDGTFTINKLVVTVSFKGNKTVIYNGANHQAESIELGCADNENASPQYSFSSSTGEYTLIMFTKFADAVNTQNENKVVISLLYQDENGKDSVYAVNAGTYTAKVGNIKSAVSGVDNFDVQASADGGLTINPARITLAWTSPTNPVFEYDGGYKGVGLTASVSVSGLTQNSFTYNPNTANPNTATLVITNSYNSNTETFTIPVSGNGQYNARATAYQVSVNTANISVSGTNRAGATSMSNYEFATINGTTYRIDPCVVTITGMNNGSVRKTYDATTAVNVPSNIRPVFNKPAATAELTSSVLNITADYDTANVGTNKTITYHITIKSGTNASGNFKFTNGSTSTNYSVNNGRIDARTLTVTLDVLRNMHATKMYNGTAFYGGQAGASSMAGSTDAVSAIHRYGEGFSVSGIASKETSNGAVIVYAMFREASEGRSDFDSFVNNVIGSGNNLGIANTKYGDEDYFYKNLVFVLDGSSARNYQFNVVRAGNSSSIGDKTGIYGEDGAVTVSGQTSGITVEITPITVSATYINVAQSYATVNNTYNTDWLDVRGTVTSVSGDPISVSVVNNWKYVNNNPNNGLREYHTYTVIRGGEHSDALTARLTSANGVHVNYRLGNQPILTIGYFVDRDEFEIGSIAGLMIASYYFTVSKDGGGEFGVIGQAKWILLATEEQYFNNTGFPKTNPDGQPFIDGDGNVVTIESWDDYFGWLATAKGGGIEVILNTSEADAGWGYYSADMSDVQNITFNRFKQVANISGVFTVNDIAILDGMFKKTVVNSDGTVNEEGSYNWGVGAKYLTNFLNLRAGSVATAMGSVFVGEFDGVYDGNGYVIDSLNIIGVANQTNNYVGMFGRVAVNAEVKNIHLRNLNITVNGANTAYVGGIAGESAQSSIENVSVHATISVNVSGTVYVGGLFGSATSSIDGAIVLGDMNITARTANVGGAIGSALGGAVNNVVSLMYVWTAVASTANVGGILGTASTATTGGVNAFMQNSVWSNRTAVAGGIPYTEMYGKSISGYGSVNKYYYFDTESSKGDYDVLDDVKLSRMDGEQDSRTNPRESMRLADIVDVYVLMYAKTADTATVDGVTVDVFGRSAESWLVGTAHGTDNAGDAIIIANQQGIALMRELRFATFSLRQNVYMYSTYQLQTAGGAFFGKVIANGFAIYIANLNSTKTVFEIEVGTATPTSVLKKA